MQSWAVDLGSVGAIYPWQGLEIVLVLFGVAAWIGFHVLQIRQEKAEYAETIRLYGSPDAVKRALDPRPSQDVVKSALNPRPTVDLAKKPLNPPRPLPLK
jgi:hypothetical protein